MNINDIFNYYSDEYSDYYILLIKKTDDILHLKITSKSTNLILDNYVNEKMIICGRRYLDSLINKFEETN